MDEHLGLQTELIGEELKEAINFFPDKIFHEYQQVFRTEATHVSIDHIQINEKDYVLETRKIPITKEGKITQVVTVIRDITKRKKAEEALRKSEEKYRTILENIREGYFEINLSGNLVFFNNSLCQILGCNEVELLGKHYKAYIAREYHKDAYQAFNLVFDLQIRKMGSNARNKSRNDISKKLV